MVLFEHEKDGEFGLFMGVAHVHVPIILEAAVGRG